MDIINGFLLGISSGVNCLSICCPYLLPFFLAEKRNKKQNFLFVLEYLSGRLISYLIIAIISASLKVAFNDLKISTKVYAFLLILSSALLFVFMLGFILNINFLSAKIKVVTNRVPFVTGFLNGFNFCPPLITAFSFGLFIGDILKNILFFTLFFLGTSLYVLPFIFLDLLAKYENLKNAGRIAGIFTSIWFFVQGINLLLK